MNVFAIDPSSTCCGYAFVTDPDPGRGVADAGRVTPPTATYMARRYGMIRNDWPLYLRRVYAMCIELRELIEPIHNSGGGGGVDAIVVETPAKAADKARQHFRGQAIYGAASGIVFDYLRHTFYDVDLIAAPADEWTRQVKKSHRAMWLAQVLPGYNPIDDSGFNAADAIELGLWYHKEQLKVTT